ncbi:regulator of G-protein signaling 7 [Lingula anatina]|uniref:Regulator of G-protein signaling 7 n=1 Tax=Lingula anatina TaxID=7574 RepID=A0A1S3HE34_LINAN|nr:regulator of G-protein signaling 7 [Lingula anatina]|eukprot:XP_013383329.1 regulator of G-protein signaling 7 [Lingula anatina]
MVRAAEKRSMAYRYKRHDAGSANGQSHEDNPNWMTYKKMEAILERMQDEQTGVCVRTVKSFMTKIPSVFTGADLISWMMRNLDVDDQTEALHMANLMASHGYMFPIDDHILSVKNDNTYYRFQTPCFWPSRSGEPENTDYAVYLCKRTMQNKQRLELADYEAENLARLQKMFSRKWEFIYMQAEAQIKVDKKRDKLERKVLDSQERAFWDVHRPVPGCVNTTEVDIKKACKNNKARPARISYIVPGGRLSPGVSVNDLHDPAQGLTQEIECYRRRLGRRWVKVSKVAESYTSYYEQYAEFDAFITPQEYANPWIVDNAELWDLEKTMKDLPQRRVKKWTFSIYELLKDPAGRDHFGKFLAKEFSGENLNHFLLDHNIFKLMKNDSYTRYLRSDMYKEFLNGTKKKSSGKRSLTLRIESRRSVLSLTNYSTKST